MRKGNATLAEYGFCAVRVVNVPVGLFFFFFFFFLVLVSALFVLARSLSLARVCGDRASFPEKQRERSICSVFVIDYVPRGTICVPISRFKAASL